MRETQFPERDRMNPRPEALNYNLMVCSDI